MVHVGVYLRFEVQCSDMGLKPFRGILWTPKEGLGLRATYRVYSMYTRAPNSGIAGST